HDVSPQANSTAAGGTNSSRGTACMASRTTRSTTPRAAICSSTMRRRLSANVSTSPASLMCPSLDRHLGNAFLQAGAHECGHCNSSTTTRGPRPRAPKLGRELLASDSTLAVAAASVHAPELIVVTVEAG